MGEATKLFIPIFRQPSHAEHYFLFATKSPMAPEATLTLRRRAVARAFQMLELFVVLFPKPGWIWVESLAAAQRRNEAEPMTETTSNRGYAHGVKFPQSIHPLFPPFSPVKTISLSRLIRPSPESRVIKKLLMLKSRHPVPVLGQANVARGAKC